MKQAEQRNTEIAGKLVLFSPLIFMVVLFVSFTGKRGSTAPPVFAFYHFKRFQPQTFGNILLAFEISGFISGWNLTSTVSQQ